MSPEEIRATLSQPQMTVMGPTNYKFNVDKAFSVEANKKALDAGRCPICNGLLAEVAPGGKYDFRIVFYVCCNDNYHRFSRPELDRKGPSAIQEAAWARM